MIPERAVLRPFCRTSLGQVAAGEGVATAFVVNVGPGESPIALTVLSLLEMGDHFSRRPQSNELKMIKESITLSDAFGSMDGVTTAASFVEFIEAGFDDNPDAAAGNMLAINLPAKTRFNAFDLSEQLLQVGDKVWLAAALYVGAPPSEYQHSATVTNIEVAGNICYKFGNTKISFQGTQGAPIIDQERHTID